MSSLSSPLDLTVLDHGTTRTISAAGELDVASAGAVRAVVAEAFDASPETVVVDLSGTTSCDTCGVRAVADAAAQADDAGVRLVVLPGPTQVHRIFELCGAAARLPFARTCGRYAGDVAGSAWRKAS